MVWYLSFTRLGPTWCLYHLLCLHYIWKSYTLSIAIRHSFKTEFETFWESTFARYGFDSLKYRLFIWTKELGGNTWDFDDFLWFQPVFTVFWRICHTGFPTDWTQCTVLADLPSPRFSVEETVEVGKTSTYIASSTLTLVYIMVDEWLMNGWWKQYF